MGKTDRKPNISSILDQTADVIQQCGWNRGGGGGTVPRSMVDCVWKEHSRRCSTFPTTATTGWPSSPIRRTRSSRRSSVSTWDDRYMPGTTTTATPGTRSSPPLVTRRTGSVHREGEREAEEGGERQVQTEALHQDHRLLDEQRDGRVREVHPDHHPGEGAHRRLSFPTRGVAVKRPVPPGLGCIPRTAATSPPIFPTAVITQLTPPRKGAHRSSDIAARPRCTSWSDRSASTSGSTHGQWVAAIVGYGAAGGTSTSVPSGWSGLCPPRPLTRC